MALIPINHKYPDQAGYTVLNTDTGRIETFSDGSFKVVSGIDVSTQEYTSGYNKILIDGIEKLTGGEVVESGNSAAGGWVRYENGVQICWGVLEVSEPSRIENSYPAGGYTSYTLTHVLPKAFIDSNYGVSLSPSYLGSVVSFIYSSSTSSEFTYYAWKVNQDTGFNAWKLNYLAVGRWK